MKNIVIGIGNPILCDDGIGIYIAERLRKKLKQFEVRTACASGLGLMEQVLGYQRAIFIDSVKTGTNAIGNIAVYSLDDFEDSAAFSIHTLDLINAIKVSKRGGIDVPEEVFFIGIEVKDNSTFTESFTSQVDAVKDDIYKKVEKQICDIAEGITNEPERCHAKNQLSE